MRNGWERQPALDAEVLAELAHRARSDAWRSTRLCGPAATAGKHDAAADPAVARTHDAGELSVVDRGRRRDQVRALDLDWLVDDTLSNCGTAQLETSATGISIEPHPGRQQRVEAQAAGCVIAASLEEAIAVIDGR